MDLEQIAAIAERELKNRATHPWKDMGNKYYHGLRVAKIALERRENSSLNKTLEDIKNSMLD